MAPAAAAAVIAWGGILIAFALWEPTGKIERVGPFALALAVAGAALVASSLWRLTMALRETQRIHRSLVDATRASLPASPLPAFVIDSRFPIVALVGLFVSRLFVARSVVDACDDGRAARGHGARAGARGRTRQPEAPADGRRARRAGLAAGGRTHAARVGRDGGAGRGRNRRRRTPPSGCTWRRPWSRWRASPPRRRVPCPPARCIGASRSPSACTGCSRRRRPAAARLAWSWRAGLAPRWLALCAVRPHGAPGVARGGPARRGRRAAQGSGSRPTCAHHLRRLVVGAARLP